MVNEPKSADEVCQALSALADGALSAQETRQLLQAWQHDSEARACWHVYQVVGDVMRSEDMAVHADRDSAFLQRLRGRLALEPVPLATTPLSEPAREALQPVAATGTLGFVAPASALASLPAAAKPLSTARSRYRLLAPVAVAAGFVAVASALVVFRGLGPSSLDGAGMASTSPALSTPAAAAPQRVGHTVLREAWLDRYLQAHRRQTPNMLVAPGGQGQVVQVVFEKP